MIGPEIRPAEAADARDIARLILLSAEHFLPAVFGSRIEDGLRRLAERRGVLFSHAHAFLAARDGRTAGMLLGYSGEEKAAEDLATGIALFQAIGPALLLRIGRLLALRRTIGRLPRDEWYVSNVAVYPSYRGQGVGRGLFLAGETAALSAGSTRIVLDVETDNAPAINLYESLGYAVRATTAPLELHGRDFSFHRMGKPLRGYSRLPIR